MTSQPDDVMSEQARGDDQVQGGHNDDDDGVVRAATDVWRDRRHSQRHRHQRHNDSSADVIVTSPSVEPPRYELFTHV